PDQARDFHHSQPPRPSRIRAGTSNRASSASDAPANSMTDAFVAPDRPRITANRPKPRYIRRRRSAGSMGASWKNHRLLHPTSISAATTGGKRAMIAAHMGGMRHGRPVPQLLVVAVSRGLVRLFGLGQLAQLP